MMPYQLAFTDTDFQNLNRGLYLHERLLGEKMEVKEGQMEDWFQKTGLQHDQGKRRLAEAGLTPDDFKSLLAGKDTPIAKGNVNWVQGLSAIFNGPHLLQEDIEFENEDVHNQEFITFVQPFLKFISFEISTTYKEWKKQFKDVSFEEAVIQKSLLTATRDSLLTLSMRVLVYELNLMRIKGCLDGETSEDRFNNFIESYISNEKDIYLLLNKYPVLARLMVETTNRWKVAIWESIERLFKDIPKIRDEFNGDFSKLNHIQTGSGDLHRDGRSVLIMLFDSGKRLVYKPRTMSIDFHFNQLLKWVNEKGYAPTFQPVKVIDRGLYGWQEYASHEECDNKSQLEHFYKRLGGYIGIFHTLHATDIHMENMVASGEHPQFIDLESLFQNFNPIDAKDLTALQKTSEELTQSVLRTAILPASLFKSGSFRSIEVSGIGGHAGQKLPRPIYKFANEKTDKMRMSKVVGYHKGASNRPSLNGEEILPENYVEEMVKGFENIYLLLEKNKDELLSENGPIVVFKEDNVRSILRHTQSYSTMLEASLHPDNLRNGLDRVQLFDYLWRIIDLNEKLGKIIPSETKDLLNGDIPYFSSKVSSTSVWDSRGKETSGFYDFSALDHTLARIKAFSKEDCHKQTRYIRTSMATMLKRWDFKEYRSHAAKQVPETLATREDFLQQAKMIGDQLMKSAFWGDSKEDVSWIGIGASLYNRWLFTPLDATMYDGVLGVALFYAYLAEVSEEEQYQDVARAAVKSAYDFLDRYDGLGSLSAFHGYASVAYVFSHLGVLWKDQTYLDEAINALLKCEKWIGRDDMFDLIGGVSGTLLVALRLYKLTGSEQARSIAVQCGNHLIQHATKRDQGYGWVSSMDGETALVGLSHGAAGIGWALAELYSCTKDEKYLEYSKQAILYERSRYIEDEGNWADLRYRDERKRLGITTPVQWCHGAAGIALGRLMTINHWEDSSMMEEIEVAINTTIREGFGGSHCQCHGDFGNLEVLLIASKQLRDSSLKTKALQIASSILEESQSEGWFCGIPQNEETPGFMLGLAGVGFGLLRFIDPDLVPSVVVLGGPVE
ncbi:type 2 lanthipeptide synthetase LanM family protein [Halobacillus ihumii]|uniref:type 2 lanthipeptide synthetase LanM family protein n=1 Tax=Halobacillus ihumii TaxID=2686092 RepID=UPI0013CFA7A8|nr:type 2 lanthipeptide synthetase LanM family protein [Halobacillus ihumii]